mmetsp:Transcript_68069/g.215335  ORF Transcript_68069/g.215335 Transcript_68069/m.215335 type:complete len:268 (-) Transcript_68069:226-1029(-)
MDARRRARAGGPPVDHRGGAAVLGPALMRRPLRQRHFRAHGLPQPLLAPLLPAVHAARWQRGGGKCSERSPGVLCLPAGVVLSGRGGVDIRHGGGGGDALASRGGHLGGIPRGGCGIRFHAGRLWVLRPRCGGPFSRAAAEPVGLLQGHHRGVGVQPVVGHEIVRVGGRVPAGPGGSVRVRPSVPLRHQPPPGCGGRRPQRNPPRRLQPIQCQPTCRGARAGRGHMGVLPPRVFCGLLRRGHGSHRERGGGGEGGRGGRAVGLHLHA